MKRNLQVLLLLLTGAGLLHIALFSDLYLRYVKAGLRPLLIASGVLLVLLGMIAAARDGFPFSRDEPGHGPDDHHDDHGHDHSKGPRIAWLLYVPALLLLLFAPPALGSYTASRNDTATTSGAGTFPALPGKDPLALSVSEFGSRAKWDTDRSLRGRTVRLTGFVTPGTNGTWYLTRLIVTCCAADATAFKVEMHGATAPPADTWVTVTGTWRPTGKVGTDSARAALDTATVKRIPEPDDPYQDLPRIRAS
ncbi:TIGR03943 family putative permease subunit [Streptomyces sp. NBC_01262]|uniref:TIGR03943 family putative permease subunit n=1 Tax=Streptomyces sp. NBC_01262 TaxID=2903803 RepID=UPI002E3777FC|nr:TIGR03943 family protein [Streptomyces sp. NBC_01262]